jgi:hypothetical protein
LLFSRVPGERLTGFKSAPAKAKFGLYRPSLSEVAEKYFCLAALTANGKFPRRPRPA